MWKYCTSTGTEGFHNCNVREALFVHLYFQWLCVACNKSKVVQNIKSFIWELEHFGTHASLHNEHEESLAHIFCCSSILEKLVLPWLLFTFSYWRWARQSIQSDRNVLVMSIFCECLSAFPKQPETSGVWAVLHADTVSTIFELDTTRGVCPVPLGTTVVTRDSHVQLKPLSQHNCNTHLWCTNKFHSWWIGVLALYSWAPTISEQYRIIRTPGCLWHSFSYLDYSPVLSQVKQEGFIMGYTFTYNNWELDEIWKINISSP